MLYNLRMEIPKNVAIEAYKTVSWSRIAEKLQVEYTDYRILMRLAMTRGIINTIFNR